MKNLFTGVEGMRRELVRGKVLLMLDFDGTLAPIAPTPAGAGISAAQRGFLARLARLPGVSVAVISGRKLSDVRRKVGLDGLIYAGNHGLEFAGIGDRLKPPVPAVDKKIVRSVYSRLVKELRNVRGVLVEDKGVTVTVHYRLADKKLVPVIGAAVLTAAGMKGVKGKVDVRRGKMSFEIRPAVDWDKGKTAEWLTRSSRGRGALPVYFGDDLTDEDAFRALAGRGITVLVGGRKRSAARYFVRDTGEVFRWLRMFMDIRQEEGDGA